MRSSAEGETSGRQVGIGVIRASFNGEYKLDGGSEMGGRRDVNGDMQVTSRACAPHTACVPPTGNYEDKAVQVLGSSATVPVDKKNNRAPVSVPRRSLLPLSKCDSFVFSFGFGFSIAQINMRFPK